jgi:ABC-2 type transport system ATP-binding protein
MSDDKSNKQETAIKVEGVSKAFKLPHEKHTTIKSAVLNSFRRKDYEKQEALKNINFEVKKGEFFGIVGRNGSGKSTLLKVYGRCIHTRCGRDKDTPRYACAFHRAWCRL